MTEDKKIYAIDFEFKPDLTPELFSYAENTPNGIVCKVFDFEGRDIPECMERIIKPLLLSADVIVAHYSVAEMKVLVKYFGIEFVVTQILPKIADTILPRFEMNTESWIGLDKQANLVNEVKYGKWKDKSEQRLDLLTKKIIYGDVDWYEENPHGCPYVEYNRQDSVVALKLFEYWWYTVNFSSLRFMSAYKLDKLSWIMLLEMEKNGIMFDKSKWEEIRKFCLERKAKYMTELSALAGVPIFYKENSKSKQPVGTTLLTSSPQLSKLLYGKMKCPVLKHTPTGNPSNDKETLEELLYDDRTSKEAAGFISVLTEFKKINYTLSNFASEKFYHERVGVDNRIRPDYSPFKVTGRMSTKEPNLHSMPARGEFNILRDMLIAPPGHLIIDIDFNQIEYRFLAEFSQCKFLCDAYRTGNIDVHQGAADLINRYLGLSLTRDNGKTLNFAQVYGQAPVTMARNFGVDLETAEEIVAAYFKNLPEVLELKEAIFSFVRKHFYITTLSGRKRDLTYLKGNRTGRLDRLGFNTLIQGSAADFARIAATEVLLTYKIPLNLFVHDELAFTVPEDRAEETLPKIIQTIENVFPFSIPIVAEGGIGKSWYSAKKDGEVRKKKK